MNWDALGAIGEIVGASAVLITLVYLARQVGHARREQQISAVRANRDERRQFFQTTRDSPYLPAIVSKLQQGEPLSPEEQYRLNVHYALAWGIMYSEWVQGQLSPVAAYSVNFDVTVELAIRQPGMVEWFSDSGERLYPDAFRSYVEKVQQRME